jgi:hypothetical protein
LARSSWSLEAFAPSACRTQLRPSQPAKKLTRSKSFTGFHLQLTARYIGFSLLLLVSIPDKIKLRGRIFNHV